MVLKSRLLLPRVSVFLLSIVAAVASVVVVDILLNRRVHLVAISAQVPEYRALVNRPNFQDVVQAKLYTQPLTETADFKYTVVTDADGRRVDEVSPAAFYPTRKNLIVLGDSFSFGAHAPYRDSLAGILERQLPQWNVHDIAVSGTSSYEYPGILAYFRHKTGVNPDFVLVGLYPCMQTGDLPRLLARQKFGPYHAVSGLLVSPSRYQEVQSLGGHLAFLAETFLRQHSSIFNLLYQPATQEEFALSLKGRMNEAELERYRAVLLQQIEQIREAAGTSLVGFWLVPSAFDLRFRSGPENYPQEDAEFFLQSSRFWKKILEELKEQRYPVVDPAEDIVLQMSAQDYPFTTDNHLSPAGFRTVARSVFGKFGPLLLEG